MENPLTTRNLECKDGCTHPVVDAFPEECFVTDKFLVEVNPRVVMVDARRGRMWVSVYNGTAEYMVERDTTRRGYKAARIYQDIQWAPPPAPAPEAPAKPTTPAPVYDDPDWYDGC